MSKKTGIEKVEGELEVENPPVSESVDSNETQSESQIGTSQETVAAAPAPAPKEKKSKSGWIAAALVVALGGWMGSGFIWPSDEDEKEVPPRLQNAEVKLVQVEAVPSRAQEVTQFIVSEGQALPNRLTQVRAEAPGNVEKLEVRKGAVIKEGDVIARLGAEDRAAQQLQAEAELTRRQRDFDAVQSLAKRGYATSARLEETRAALASAKAQIASVSETMSETVIRAPFSGVLDDLTIELGELVSGGQDVGIIVDVDPLIVEVQVPQQSVGKLKAEQTAEISFITGEKRAGTIRYVSSNAKPSTRTFTAEIEVPNPERNIPAGVSAQARIPTSSAEAHFVSPAVLSLGSDGTLGVKTVTADETVKFYPIEMVRAETRGIWVKGLPQEARIITVGQGFVSEGEKVKASDGKVDPDIKPKPTNSTQPVAAASATSTQEPEAKAAGDKTGAAGEITSAMTPKAPEPADTIENKPIIAPAGQDAVQIARLPEPAVAGERQIKDMIGATRTVQSGLNELGYNVGAVDGVIGGNTRDAIRQFQKSLGLDVTGNITFDLLDALAEALKTKG